MYIFPRSITIRHLGKRNSSLFGINNILHEDNLTKTAAKFANMTSIRMQAHEPPRKAAVLIPLCIVDDKVSLLYTLRAANLKSHKGQVSFPGGMLDAKDKSLVHTAMRETREELGLNEANLQIWGSGKLIITKGDVCVLPVIGQITKALSYKSLKINHNEVEDVFAVPLENLCNPKLIAHTQFRNGYSIPVYLGAPRKIWGLTAAITHEFLKALMPSDGYSNDIKYVTPVKIQ